MHFRVTFKIEKQENYIRVSKALVLKINLSEHEER